MNVRFVVIAPKTHACTRDVRLPILVGRSEEAKFRIRDDRISRRHCELTVQDGVVMLRDLGSTNGTFLNDEPLQKDAAVEVPPEAVVRVGNCAFRVEYDSPAAQTAIAKQEESAGAEMAAGAEADDEPQAESPTSFAFDAAAIKDATVASKQDAWPSPADEGEAAEDEAPDDEALGDFFKGLK